MYKRRKRYEGKAPVEERESSVFPVPTPGNKSELIPNEKSAGPERRQSPTRTKTVTDPNEDSAGPERSVFFGRKRQLSGKKYSSTAVDIRIIL